MFLHALDGSWRRIALSGLLLALAGPRLTRALCAQAPDPTPTPAFAQGAPYRVTLDQLTGRVEVLDHRGRVHDRWTPGAGSRAAALASIPPKRAVVVELLNANPLLYRYDVTASVVARGSTKSCTGIGGRFAASGFLTSLMAVSGQAPMQQLPDPSQFTPPPPPPPVTRGEGRLTASFLQAAAEQLRLPVAAYLSTLQRVRELPPALEDSLALAAELGESLPLDSLLGALQTSVEREVPGLQSASQVALMIRRKTGAHAAAVAELAGYARAIRSGEYEGNPNDPAVRELALLSTSVDQAEQETRAAARKLQAQLRRIELARQGTRQRFTLEASGDYRRISIEAQPTPEFPEALRLRAGRQELFSQPVTSVLCEISLGVAFMDRPPRYEVENGALVDRDAAEDRTSPSFMIHFALARVPWIGAMAGLGFGSSARPDFYLGGSVRLLEPLLINVGMVWQRFDRLPGGLALGDAVPDQSVLNDLPRRYHASLFWGFSIGR